MYYNSIIKSIIHQLKTKYPYDIRMSREKYNEWIQDLLYEDITSQLWQVVTMTIWHYDKMSVWHNDTLRNTINIKLLTKQLHTYIQSKYEVKWII